MHNAVAQKFGVFKRGNHTENTFLFGKLEVRLKSHDIVRASFHVFAPKLNYRVVAFARLVEKTHGAKRSEQERVSSAPRHNFDGHTPLEYVRLFKFVQHRAFGCNESGVKLVVLLSRHRTVKIIALAFSVSVGGECPT